jgi:hypothetical protein
MAGRREMNCAPTACSLIRRRCRTPKVKLALFILTYRKRVM